jgi:hypothetical protein
VVPSHPELPHGGNLGNLLAKYSDCTMVGDSRGYHLFYPEHDGRLNLAELGTVFDLGGTTFTVLPAVIRDLPNTVWRYESGSGVMFTSDGFIYAHHPASLEAGETVHGPAECGLVSSELPLLPTLQLAAINTASGLYWTRYHDASSVFDELDELLQAHPTMMFAPTHGNVVVGKLDEITQILKAGLRSSFGRDPASPN